MSDFAGDGHFSGDSDLIRSGLNLIQQAISIFDAELKLKIWNARFVEMFSFPDHLMRKGTSFEDIMTFLARRGEYGPGNVEEMIRERVERAKAFEPHYFERTRPDGSMISVEGHPLAQGGWVSVYTDITTQKRQEAFLEERRDLLSDRLLQHSGMLAEANRQLSASNRALEEVKRALTESEHRMRAITESMPAHIAYLTPDYEYTYSNNRFSDTMGMEHPVVVGKNVAEIFGPQIFARIKPALDQALEGDRSLVEFQVPFDSEDAQIIRTTFTPDENNDGTVRGLFVQSLNITEEVRTMKALLQSKRMETTVQLTSGLAHDFSNILTVILGNLKRIEEAQHTPGPQTPIVHRTQKAAQRAVRIIGQLMSFSGKQSLAPKRMDVSCLLVDLTKLVTASLPDGVTLELIVPDAPVYAFADESALQDVLVNLILNARDAVDGSGIITIAVSNKLSSPQNMVEIAVKDNGCGFDKETLERAYEPFFTSKHGKGGSGLGLSMAQGFASQSGGDIHIQSQLNAGSTITLSLPVSDFQTSQDLPGVLDEDLRQGNRLALLIDDEYDVRRSIRDVLKDSGFSVIEATSASEARDLFRHIDDVGLVVSDVMMPGDMNGVELCQSIRKENRKTPIILVSGLPADHEILNAARGEFPVLGKPLDGTRLKETYSQLLRTL